MTGQEILQELNNISKLVEESNKSIIEYKNMCIEHKQSFSEEYMKIKNSLMENVDKFNLILDEAKLLDNIIYSNNELLPNIQSTRFLIFKTIKELENTFKTINMIYES